MPHRLCCTSDSKAVTSKCGSRSNSRTSWKAEQTMQLAKAISSYTHLPIVEALRGIERGSQYDAKKRGQTLSAENMGFYRHKDLPSNRTPYLIDNVVDTGNTAKAAIKALGSGTVASFAMSDTFLQREEAKSLRR